MAPPADHYTTLGVPRTADTATITKAFRKLARKSHPDLNKDKHASARFKAVAEAYAVLKNPDKRAAYDNPAPPPTPQRSPPHPARAHRGHHPSPPDDSGLADLLAAFTRGMREGRAGETGGATAHPQPGHSHEHAVPLALRDAHLGTTLRLNLPGPLGEPSGRSLDVTIPPGTSHGQTLRLRGRGGAGVNGGPAGDIYLHIALQPDPVFSLHGHDLYMELTLAPWQAVLGADVEVPTLEGPVLLTVPSGTRAGRKLRLRGRGLLHPGGRGDLYAVTRIDVPAGTSIREEALYRSLAQEASTAIKAEI